ncbi:MAG TPA: hypothetical protein O0X42_04800 [Methanocorpusculum sp.]|nr:hypothetical protein [Methanocorpusculum sp.]
MNFKHLALLGAIALVVLGCVLAAGCTSTEQTPADNPLSSVVGVWYCTEPADSNGNPITAIQTIKADGTGCWMQLADDNPGIQLIKAKTSVFTVPDKNGVFEKKSSDGNTYKMVYDSTKDIIRDEKDEKITYTRLDPLVGIWYGAAENGKSRKTTTLFKPDGTGVLMISNQDNGTADLFTLTWKKNADGTYAVKFSDGEERTYTVDASGLNAATSSGMVRTKAFTDSTFLMSVTGAWYNEERNALAAFNADGTGFLNYVNGILPFTWRLKDIGTFEVSYTGGNWDDGSSAKGKVTEWTYDRENDVFTSSYGIKYIRPAETVEGKITLS